MRPIDVVMLTKNSDRFLRACLKSVYENVPVRRLIVIDAYSSDNTHGILAEFEQIYGNVDIISEKGSRGEARQKGIQEAQTDWFLFVDSDVVLCENWFSKASRHIEENVGAIWGVDLPGDVNNRILIKMFKWMEGRVFAIRGGCHDILVRKEAVKDIRIPKHLHVLEDAYIKEWIEAKNMKVIIDYSSTCRHYKQMDSLLSRENVSSEVFELKNFKHMQERLVYASAFALTWLLQQVKSRSTERDL
jgi:glycosyltransferase involved in cell wall biosynthesis